MQDYAKAELLCFQKKYQETLTLLNQMIHKYPGHSLIDEIYWLKAKIYLETAHFEKAISELEEIVSNYNYDILSDDAHFLMAKIVHKPGSLTLS